MVTVILIILGVLLVVAVVIRIVEVFSPEGWEDESGFHYGRR